MATEYHANRIEAYAIEVGLKQSEVINEAIRRFFEGQSVVGFCCKNGW